MFNQALYLDHLEQQTQYWSAQLTAQNKAGVIIPSGQPIRVYWDDNDYPFKSNFHFALFVPEGPLPHSYLLLEPGKKPCLIYYQPADYWHVVAKDPNPGWASAFDVIIERDTNSWQRHAPKDLSQWIWVGAPESSALDVLPESAINPTDFVHAVHYQRAFKTDYEVDCLASANLRAARGHNAARWAFLAEATEFEIHLEYMAATGHAEADLPYGNIIALGPNGAILHYTHLQRHLPEHDFAQSFLIDAGAKHNHYCADITRTWSTNDNFSAMIEDFDHLQQAIVSEVRPGVSFVDLHLMTHRRLATFLIDHDLAKGSTDQLVDEGVTATFYPHGLGHMLGLQVHDIGGHQQDALGTIKAPPSGHPYLRLTRELQAGYCVTIEPGLYFIDLLLDKLKATPGASLVNWDLIEELKPLGGIRIEDDVVVTDYGHQNLSRQAFSQLAEDD